MTVSMLLLGWHRVQNGVLRSPGRVNRDSSPVNYIMSVELPPVIFWLGAPGSGKGTQCEILLKKYDTLKHLSVGDLLRAEVADPNSPNNAKIRAILDAGNLVPPEITVSIVRNELERATEYDAILLDGFPRDVPQANAYLEQIGVHERGFVIFLECGQEECTRRLIERGKTSGRSDDNLECIQKRFNTMRASTEPVVAEWEAAGRVVRIEGERTREEVAADVEKLLQSRGIFK